MYIKTNDFGRHWLSKEKAAKKKNRVKKGIDSVNGEDTHL